MKKKILNNKKFILIFILSFILFLTIFNIFYPGIYTYDSIFQWNEVIKEELTESHPFLSTYFLYILSKIYNYPTIVIIFQILISSFTITKMFKISNIKNNIIEIILCILICISPLICLFSITMWKDILYSYYLINLALLLYEWSKSNYKMSTSNFIFMGIILFLIYSYRINGKITAILLLLYIIVKMIKQKYKVKTILIMLTTFLSLLCVLQIPKSYYVKNVDTNVVSNEHKPSTIDNYMIWITGEYLNNGHIENEDRQFLKNITNLEIWRATYHPYVIDVTNHMKKNEKFLYENNKEFRNIFIKMTKENFKWFINHYIQADSLLLSPYSKGYIYSYGIFDGQRNSIIDLKPKSKNQKLYITYTQFVVWTLKNKIVRTIYYPANAMYLSIIFALIIFKKYKNKKIFILLIPMLFNTLSLLPINIAQDIRYVYINYLTFISLLLILIKYMIKKKEKKPLNKNILIFSGYYLPHLGGIERYINNLSTELKQLGWDVTIVSSNYDKLKSTEIINGIKTFRLPIYNLFKTRYPIPKHNKDFKSIINKLDEKTYDAIIVNTRFHLTSLVGAKYGKERSIPVFLIEHGAEHLTIDNKLLDYFGAKYEHCLTIYLKRYVDYYYGVSKKSCNWQKHFHILSNGVWYNSISNFYDINKISKKNNKKIIITYAGRILRQKGLYELIDSFNEVIKTNNNIELHIAGDGNQLEKLKEINKNNKKIIFEGKLDFNDLIKLYNKTNIFVYTPIWPEGLPGSIIEAGYMKCACIVSSQGGIKEIIDNNVNGIIIKNEQELINALNRLIDDKKLRENLGTNLQKIVLEKFYWENTAKQIEKDIIDKISR